MIDYATWAAIGDGVAKHLTAAQLAVSLGLDVKTVRHWIGRPYAPRQAVRRSSKLDPFKVRIVGWLVAQPLSAQQVYLPLCAAGYAGGVSIVKDYVRRIRPRPRAAILTLAFAPKEMAQVDGGDGGTIAGGCPFSSWCWPIVVRWSRIHPGTDGGALPGRAPACLHGPGGATADRGR